MDPENLKGVFLMWRYTVYHQKKAMIIGNDDKDLQSSSSLKPLSLPKPFQSQLITEFYHIID